MSNPVPTKACSRCGEEKPATPEYFHRNSECAYGVVGVCKPCIKAGGVAWQARNRERQAEIQRRGNLRFRYRLEAEEYDAMLESQGGVCAICGELPEGERLSVDHDNNCCDLRRSKGTLRRACGGCNRGLLCAFCNHGLGRFRDDPDRLRRAAAYLEASKRPALRLVEQTC